MIQVLLLATLTSGSLQHQLVQRYALISSAAPSNDTRTASLVLSDRFQQTLVNGGVLDKAAYLSTTLGYDPTREILHLRYSIQDVKAFGGHAVVKVKLVGSIRYGWPGRAKNMPARWIESDEDKWVQQLGEWDLESSRQISVRSWIGGKLVQSDRAPKPITLSERGTILHQLRRNAVPVRTTLSGDTADLAALGRWMGSSRIVGLGEATHGTREFSVTKDRIFRYLVQHLHFSIFAMEADWSVGLAIDHYITTGQGNIRALLASTYAVWNNQETLDVLTWMRQYNAQPGRHPELHFVGIDVEDPHAAAEIVEQFFKANAPGNLAEVTADLQCMGITGKELSGYIFGSPAAQQACQRGITSVMALLDKARGLHAIKAPVDYTRIRHATEAVLQGAELYAAEGRGDNSVRDRVMADNLVWATHIYPNARIAVWAHNFHIAAYPSLGFTSMGSVLRQRFGRNYYAVGFAFDHGAVSPNGVFAPIVVPPAYPLTAEAILREVQTPAYALNLDAVPIHSPLGRWLNRPEPIQAFGSIGGPQDLRQRFALVQLPRLYDALIFVHESHAPQEFTQPK
jgi:erythromycin esterase